jgi:Protein of unknown function (DUF2637)
MTRTNRISRARVRSRDRLRAARTSRRTRRELAGDRRTRRAHRPARQTPRAVPAANRILRAPRRVALVAIAAVITAASGTSFAESYRGLYLWAVHHGLSGVWAWAWPLQVDTFIAVGELALFVALVDHWKARTRVAAWLVTLAGLMVSVAGNVGHVYGHNLMNRGTAAVPPLAAAAALAVGLGVLKRIAEDHYRQAAGELPGKVEDVIEDQAADVAEELPAAGPPPVPDLAELEAMTKADAIRIALQHCDGSVIQAQRWLADLGLNVDRAYAHDVKAGRSGKHRGSRAAQVTGPHALPAADQNGAAA